MCGYNALQYVRYRHDDNDLVRSARQQEFLREARQELPPAGLIASDRDKLKNILTEVHDAPTFRTPATCSRWRKLFLAAAAPRCVQVHFPAQLGGPTATYVTASDAAIKEAVAKFRRARRRRPPGDVDDDRPARRRDGRRVEGRSGSGGEGGSDPEGPRAARLRRRRR